MGLTLLGALTPFPSQGDPLHYETQLRSHSHLKALQFLDVSQCLVPHSSCSPTSALFQALHFIDLPGRCGPASPPPVLSDTGVSGHLTPCTVGEPLAGWVSLELNMHCLLRSGTQTGPLTSGCAYTGSSCWPGGQHTGSSSPAQPSSCLMRKMPNAPPTRLQAGQSVVPPSQRQLASCVYTQPPLRHQFLVSVLLLGQ